MVVVVVVVILVVHGSSNQYTEEYRLYFYITVNTLRNTSCVGTLFLHRVIDSSLGGGRGHREEINQSGRNASDGEAGSLR